MFQVNSKGTRTTSMTAFFCIIVNFEHIAHIFPVLLLLIFDFETSEFLLDIAWNHIFWKPKKVFKLNIHQTSQKQSPAASNFIKKQLHVRCFNSFMTVVLSYRNQSIDLEKKSIDWFLYKRTSVTKQLTFYKSYCLEHL